MNEHVKFYAKLSFKSILKWLFIAAVGLLLTLIFFFVILVQSSDLMGGMGGAHGGGGIVALQFIVALAVSNPCGCIIFMGAPIFLVLYFLVANKVVIDTLLFGIWKKNGARLVEPKIKLIVEKFIERNPNWMKTITKQARLKSELLQLNKNDPTNSTVQRKVINYLLKKIKLDQLDLKREDLNLPEAVTQLASKKIAESTEPSFLLFWILLGIQVTLFICSQVFGS